MALAVLPMMVEPAFAQHPVAEAQIHQREAAQSYRTGDFEGFTRSLEIALELNPASYATRYNLACGYALTGRNEEALMLLTELTNAKVDFGMARDPDFTSLRDTERFQELVALLESSIIPISNSSTRLTVEQLGLMPEGIAIDEETGRLFFGSMRNGNIYVIDSKGSLSKFSTVRYDGKLGAIGITVDNARNLLWSIGTAFFQVEEFDADAPARSGVFGFDLTTGELKHEYIADASVQGLNDVTVAPSGDLYVSGNVLHVIRAGSDAMEPFATSPDPFGSNGITVEPSGKTLFVSSYPVGIAAIDIDSGALHFLDAPQATPLYGIDGLYWYEGDLIAIQNGIQPWRLMRLSLNDDLTAVTDVRVIEFANDDITPTTGAIVGHEIHYVGQGPAPEVSPSQFPEALAPFSARS